MHTAIGSLRLRSRGAHCDRILAVEVQGCKVCGFLDLYTCRSVSISRPLDPCRYLNRDLSEFHDGSQTTRPVDGSQKVCYVGMAPSSSKVYADNRSASGKCCPRMAHERSILLL